MNFISLLNYAWFWINFNLQGDSCALLLETFFDVMGIFGSIEPKIKCNLQFQYNIIFQSPSIKMLKTRFFPCGTNILHHNFSVESSLNNLTEYSIKIATYKFTVLI